MKTLQAVDLFSGAGGTSTGLVRACAELGYRLRLTAVNHWPVAVESHAANHPDAEHLCEELDSVNPRKIVRGRLDILCASPECTHHSNARGGKPCSDQSRATAWHVVRWAEALRPKAILVENVREFLNWGPLGTDGRPLKSKRGQVFQAWVKALEAIGYKVSWRLVNAADFGGATTRTRLFVLAIRGRGPIPWAEPTHERNPQPSLFGQLPPWRAAREVLDFSIPSRSIFGRKHPLKPNTINRIAEGIRRFWGVDPEPFLVRLRGTSEDCIRTSALPITGPIPTLTGGQHIGLAEPFVLGQQSGAIARSTDDPIPTIATRGAVSLVQPFIVPQFSSNAARSVDQPIGGITTTTRGMGLVQPFLMHTTHQGGNRVASTDDPLATITGANRGEQAVVEPFIVPTNYGEREGQTPRTHAVTDPLPTIVGSNTHGLIEPFLVSYYGNGQPLSVGDPIDTITGTDRFGLVTPGGAVVVDILFRMLQPSELAAGMGFPAGYIFRGTRADVVKQIGNAVEVHKAQAHLAAMIRHVA